MNRKAALVVIVIVAALAGGCLFWRYWRGGHPDLLVQTYRHEKFGYSLDYSTSWQVGYLGDSQGQGNPVWFVSNAEDVELAEGGLPHEVTVPVVVHNLEDLAEVDPSMPEIDSSWDWVSWRRSQWDKSDHERLGSYQDREVTIDEKLAVRTTYAASSDESGPWIVVVLYDSNDLVYQIEYVGRQPFYDENIHHFEALLASFQTGK